MERAEAFCTEGDVVTDHYIHHVPGRLRVRTAVVKGNEKRATAVKALLQSTEGVRAVAVNPLTGSVTIHYDEKITNSSAVLDVLNREGYPVSQTSVPAVGLASPAVVPSSQLGSALAAAAATFLVKTAIEYSLRAVVASVL